MYSIEKNVTCDIQSDVGIIAGWVKVRGLQDVHILMLHAWDLL